MSKDLEKIIKVAIKEALALGGEYPEAEDPENNAYPYGYLCPECETDLTVLGALTGGENGPPCAPFTAHLDKQNEFAGFSPIDSGSYYVEGLDDEDLTGEEDPDLHCTKCGFVFEPFTSMGITVG